MVKRGKLEIMKDILSLIKENRNSIKPTPLLRKSKISSARFKEYYLDLLQRELILEYFGLNQNKFVSLTDKGFRFLERYKSIVDFIDDFEL